MKTTTLLFSLFFAFVAIGHNKLQLSSHYTWSSDTSISFQLKGTNFNQAFLGNIEISSSKQQLFILDSVLVNKGIFSLQKQFALPIDFLQDLDSSAFLTIKLYAHPKQNLVATSKLLITKSERPKPVLNYSDTTLQFKYSGNGKRRVYINLSTSIDSIVDEKFQFSITHDTTLFARDVISAHPFATRKLSILIKEKNKTISQHNLYYTKGLFGEKLDSAQESPRSLAINQKAIDINGNFYIENNNFSRSPQHASGLQYPSTLIRASNTINLLGLPFRINAHHNTSNVVDPNFRNFFSFEFDVNAYRRSLRQKLLKDEKLKQYSIDEIDHDLSSNEASIEKLKSYKRILLQYPDQNIEVDSLFKKEVGRLQKSEIKDTIPLNQAFDTTTLVSKEDSLYKDSLVNQNQAKIEKINKLIKRFEASNRYKEQLRKQQIDNPTSIDYTAYSSNKLFQRMGKKSLSTLLRFEKFQLGYFYEEGGKYSIRDVEMKGLNTSFLLSSNVEVGLLRAHINSFQSYNLDELNSNIRVSSAFVRHRRFDYFRPEVRVTEFHDLAVDPELSPVSTTNYILSFQTEGEVSSFLFYELEIDRSKSKFADVMQEDENFMKETAVYGKIEVEPFDFLGIKASYDQVGSNFQSEGVYFLTRNLQSYSLGTHLKLFDHKIYLKNDYTIINRNYEQKELVNQSQKLFFDVGSRFKRIPNFQIIHSPITVDIANKLDTSFAGLNAFSSVTIARIFYVKKIKRTLFNSALIYSEIQNDFFNGSEKQSGFQHYVGISNKKMQFSFTSSYREMFEKLRFISASVNRQINDRLGTSIYAAKNFADDRYSEIVRSKLTYMLHKSLQVGAGAALLLEKGQAANWGSTVSLRLNY
ncbi:MAG: hypothetical protein RIC95_03175 [Vicingaceae bacterium]